MMRLQTIVLAGAVLAGGAVVAPAQAATSLQPHGSILQVQGYRIDLGEADDPKAARAWQGPIRVTRTSGNACTVSQDVAILQKPFGLSHGHLLVVSTYSGSEARVYVVDLQDCAVRAQSRPFTGAPSVEGDEVLTPHLGRFKIDRNGQLLRELRR